MNITTECRVGKFIYCSADGYPPPRVIFIDNIRRTVTHDNKVQLMEAGPFNYTCIAYVNVSCEENNPICRLFGSMAIDYGNDPNFPFSLFNTTRFQYGDTEYCDANKSVDGYAIGELTCFLTLKKTRNTFCRTLSLSNQLFFIWNKRNVTFIQFKICCCVYNFMKIGCFFTAIWRYIDFQNSGRPPSWNCFTTIRPPTKYLLLAAAACQISCQSDTQI